MNDEIKREFEETALLGCKAVRVFLASEGANADCFKKARAGAVAMSSYARLRATLANEEAIRLTAQRLGASPATPSRELPAGGDADE